MISKTKSTKFLFLMILMLFLTTFVGSVFGQSSVVIPVDIELQDLKEVDRRLQELELLRQKSIEQEKTIVELENSLSIKGKTNELSEREIYLLKKIIEIKDTEIQALNRNFDQMKEVADRSLKLAEVSKPKSNILLIIAGVVTVFLLGLALGL
jgi:hypothetical protein